MTHPKLMEVEFAEYEKMKKRLAEAEMGIHHGYEWSVSEIKKLEEKVVELEADLAHEKQQRAFMEQDRAQLSKEVDRLEGLLKERLHDERNGTDRDSSHRDEGDRG